MCCCDTKKKTPETTVQDVVCGMNVDPAASSGSTKHDGKTYFFCSAGCKRSFEAEPMRYIASTSAETAACCSPQPEMGAM
ncbi:hypothetical protein BH10ACI4_BH10ACI4_06100 [soil metagenome]